MTNDMNSDEARRILAAIDAEQMVRLALELVRIPSYKTEETEVARFCRATCLNAAMTFNCKR